MKNPRTEVAPVTYEDRLRATPDQRATMKAQYRDWLQRARRQDHKDATHVRDLILGTHEARRHWQLFSGAIDPNSIHHMAWAWTHDDDPVWNAHLRIAQSARAMARVRLSGGIGGSHSRLKTRWWCPRGCGKSVHGKKSNLFLCRTCHATWTRNVLARMNPRLLVRYKRSHPETP